MGLLRACSNQEVELCDFLSCRGLCILLWGGRVHVRISVGYQNFYGGFKGLDSIFRDPRKLRSHFLLRVARFGSSSEQVEYHELH